MNNYTLTLSGPTSRRVTTPLLICMLTLLFGTAAESAPSRWTEVTLDSGQFQIAATPEWVRPVEARDDGSKAPLSMRLWDEQFRFGTQDGTKRYTHIQIDGQDPAQFKQQCRQTIPFNPQYEKLELHTLALWRDGKPLDQLPITKPRMLTADGATTTIYGGQVTVLLEVGDCRPGDQLEIAWSVIGSNPVFAGQAYAVQPWAKPWPVTRRTLSFSYPPAMPMHVDVVQHSDPELSSFPKLVKREERSVGAWQHVSFEGLSVSAVKWVADGAQGSIQTDLVTTSSFADWQQVTQWAAALFDRPAAHDSAAYQVLLADINKQATQSERVGYALRWIQREIRYVSVSLGENSHRPSSPDDVLARRYGDCKDVSQLLTHLLRDAGVTVQPALMLSFNSRLAAKLTGVPWFDHAVALAWVDGHVYVLDATRAEQPSRLERMAAWHGLSQVMVVGGEHAGFLTVPWSGEEQDRTLVRDEYMKVDAKDHSGLLTVKVTLRGVAAEQQRQTMRHAAPEQVKADVLKQIRQLHPNAQWHGEPGYQDDEVDNRIVMAGVFRVVDPFRRRPGGQYRYEYSDKEITDHLTRVGNAHRRVPVGLRADPQRVVFTHTLELPAGWKVDEASYDETVKVPAFILHTRRSQPGPNILVDHTELMLSGDEVPAPEIFAYQAAAQRVFDIETTLKVNQ